ncbi:DUF6984 family protein [Sphingobacterium multivorum]|uniref:DUF6984 family protein n=1 Tax=Sphingobacterium multivorum TaxID=28454 RepID=UPI0035E4167D
MNLISFLVRDTPEGEKIITTLEDIFVEKMDDSGMGSLQVILEGADHRRFGEKTRFSKNDELID